MHPKIIFSFKVWLLMQISNTVTFVSYLLLLVLNPVTYGKTPFSLFTVPVRSRRFSLQELHSQHFPGQTFFIFILSKFWNIAAVQSIWYCLRCCLFSVHSRGFQPYVWFMWVIFSSTHGFELSFLLSIILTAALGTIWFQGTKWILLV